MDREEEIGYDSLARLRITNFQSIRDLDIGFGRFTVLVGPSSSGKSAILRAVRVLVRNTSSTSYVSYGQSSFKVEAVFGDTTLSIERGKGKSTYDLEGVPFPKAGTGVPDVVERHLRLSTVGGLEVALADQFDRPFLLAESGSTAAKVLGELTNASLLLRASGEANRRRQGFVRLAAVRSSDVDAVRSRLVHAGELRAEQDSLRRARSLMDTARDLDGEVERLANYLTIIDIAQKAAAHVRAEAREVPELRPQLAEAARFDSECETLGSIIQSLERNAALRASALHAVVEVQDEIVQIRQQEKDVLRELGRCPVCGQSTEGV